MKRLVCGAVILLCSVLLPARAVRRQPPLRLRGGVKGIGQFGKVIFNLCGDSPVRVQWHARALCTPVACRRDVASRW